MDDRYLKQGRPGSRRYRKRVLAVRAMAGETAWLEGSPVWHDGRVVWETDRGIVAPDRSMISLAQRRLGQIAGYPRASRQALGDASGWLIRRLNRLNVAKRLAAFYEPDLAALCKPTSLRHMDERGTHHLASLLVVEACCLNRLPASPAYALFSCGGRAVQPLLAIVLDHDKLPPGRALAALVLGALRKAGKLDIKLGAPFASEWEERAYAWGLRNSLPDDPALFVALLKEEGSAELAEQFAFLHGRVGTYLPDIESLRRLLERDVRAGTVVEVCRVCAEIEPLAKRIGSYRAELPGKHLHWRAEVASDLRNERGQTIGELVNLMHKYACGTADPATVEDALALEAHIVHASDKQRNTLGMAANAVLQLGLDLPVELQGTFLRLLNEYRAQIWDEIEESAQPSLSRWADEAYSSYAVPIFRALSKRLDPGLVRQALKINRHHLLAHYDFKDADTFAFALSVLADFGPDYRAWTLMSTMARLNFGTAKEAKQAIGPLLRAVMQAPPDTQGNLFDYFLDELPVRPADARDKAHKWAHYVPHMSGFLVGERTMPYTLVRMVVALDKSRGDSGLDWFRDLLGVLNREMAPDADIDRLAHSLRVTVPLGLALAGDDHASFQHIALSALSHSFDQDLSQIERAIEVLRRFPILSLALARIFPLQPHRCMDLTVKIGLTSQLGREAIAPLSYLEGDALGEVELPEEWVAVVAAAPGVEEAVRSYLLAQRVRGDSDAVPPGVRKALEQPQRLAGELAYIERKLVENPGRADLSARAGSLRSRLANDGKLMSEVRVEIEERLGQAVAEAHIACAETKMLECYRARLQALAGPLPHNLRITDNLVNATLLLGDIDSNRKLLMRLLRAYLRGDRRWSEHHPTNVRFIGKLAEAGVDTGVWLSANPRKYPCKGVAGGRVRIMLERDPLGVLQMGNYFDTCLSFDGVNAFSTVANACELNKRVVYAYDSMDRVIGRKLIGINRDSKLIGFYTYSTLGDEEGKALRSIFRRYCADFAQRCGLELADQGTVPRLYAEAWYDDGAVPWSDAEDEQGQQRPSHNRSGAPDEQMLVPPISAVPEHRGAVATVHV